MIRHSAIAVGYGVLGAALVLLGLYIYLLESRSDLRVWHLAELDAEYRADDAADIGSFADYQRLEQRLFNQLQEQVYARVQPSADRILDRYNSQSPLDPAGHPINYNRSFQLPVDDPIVGKQRLPFELNLVTNQTASGDHLVARIKAPGAINLVDYPLDLRWPREIFSLSHVSIPFPPDDVLYGGRPDVVDDPRWITLGSVSIRGEHRVLQIPDSYFVRLRYNPFFSYLQRRMIEFLGLAREPVNPTRTPAG